MAMERLQEEEEEEEDDTGEPTTTQCTNHHLHKPTSPNGICPFCLQEKLTKLLSSTSTSSSFPPIHPSTSSPTSPNNSSRSDFIPPKPTPSLNITHHLNTTTSTYNHHQCQSSGAFFRIPYVHTPKKKNKNKDQEKDRGSSSVFLNRSNSTRTPRSGGRDFSANDEFNYTPRRRGLFWSFISLSRNPSSKKIEDNRNWRDETEDVSLNGFVCTRKREDLEEVLVEEEESHQETAASDRKVTRSRSVGCGGGGGSQRFPGEFFDRISTGFGDCALRRVESYRESKQKITAAPRRRRYAAGGGGQELIKCSGIFGGFAGASSSSSSSSSSYLVSSSGEDSRAAAAAAARHGRSKSWGWALASPLRAFHRHSSHGKREDLNKKKKNSTSPNLNAIPSLLVLRG